MNKNNSNNPNHKQIKITTRTKSRGMITYWLIATVLTTMGATLILTKRNRKNNDSINNKKNKNQSSRKNKNTTTVVKLTRKTTEITITKITATNTKRTSKKFRTKTA